MIPDTPTGSARLDALDYLYEGHNNQLNQQLPHRVCSHQDYQNENNSINIVVGDHHFSGEEQGQSNKQNDSITHESESVAQIYEPLHATSPMMKMVEKPRCDSRSLSIVGCSLLLCLVLLISENSRL